MKDEYIQELSHEERVSCIINDLEANKKIASLNNTRAMIFQAIVKYAPTPTDNDYLTQCFEEVLGKFIAL